jgi:hypothetical protein
VGLCSIRKTDCRRLSRFLRERICRFWGRGCFEHWHYSRVILSEAKDLEYTIWPDSRYLKAEGSLGYLTYNIDVQDWPYIESMKFVM